MIRWGLPAVVALALCAAGAARADCKLVKLGELPVTMDGTRPIVSAKINGTDVRFLADTGAFYSTLSEASARALKLSLRPAPFQYQMVGVGGASSMSETFVEDFQLNQIALKHIEFIVGGSETGSHAVGLLGQNVWRNFDVDYDFAAGEIRLMHAQDCSRMALAYWTGGKPFSMTPIEAVDDQNPKIRGTVLVNGVRVQAMFDTGASRSVISLEAAARAGVRPDSPGVVRAGFSTGIGQKALREWVAPFASVQIGDEQVHNTKLYMSELGPQNNGMLIGADFFLSHHVFVANSQRKMYFTYSGGSVFDMSTPPAAEMSSPGTPPPGTAASASSIDQPTTADAFSRRGAVLAARGDAKGALADFDRACQLAPTEPRYFLQRAQARAKAGQSSLALADLDAAVRLQPDDVQARLARAGMRLEDRDRVGARADVDAAAISPGAAQVRLQIAEFDLTLDQFRAAADQFGLWLPDHPEDNERAAALGGRCRARALGGIELDGALEDCNAALRLAPQGANAMDSRAIVFIRRGAFERAIADCDAALALRPKSAWSLYARGLAEAKSGDQAKADADFTAAAAIQPRLAQRLAKLGLAP